MTALNFALRLAALVLAGYVVTTGWPPMAEAMGRHEWRCEIRPQHGAAPREGAWI